MIAGPPLESCTSSSDYRIAKRRGAVIDSAKAMQFARNENSKGVGNESYDFYLLLKSERMAGWPLPANLQRGVIEPHLFRAGS